MAKTAGAHSDPTVGEVILEDKILEVLENAAAPERFPADRNSVKDIVGVAQDLQKLSIEKSPASQIQNSGEDIQTLMELASVAFTKFQYDEAVQNYIREQVYS